MEQIDIVEQTRLPPPITHPDADASGAKILKSRLFKIGMTGDMSSKIFDAGDERMIVRWQSGNDLRKDTVDAASLLKLKNPTVVENFQVTVMLVST
jgi:hypothetical protein